LETSSGFCRLPHLRSWIVFSISLVCLAFWPQGAGGWAGLLADGDAGWNIRTGDYILSTHQIPAERPVFRFSKPDDVWYAWEWLTDVIFSLPSSELWTEGIVLFGRVVISLAMTLLLVFI